MIVLFSEREGNWGARIGMGIYNVLQYCLLCRRCAQLHPPDGVGHGDGRLWYGDQ